MLEFKLSDLNVKTIYFVSDGAIDNNSDVICFRSVCDSD